MKREKGYFLWRMAQRQYQRHLAADRAAPELRVMEIKARAQVAVVLVPAHLCPSDGCRRITMRALCEKHRAPEDNHASEVAVTYSPRSAARRPARAGAD